jgi:ABC-type Fe3+/spermidine/putrescine transport system ATPase subunit
LRSRLWAAASCPKDSTSAPEGSRICIAIRPEKLVALRRPLRRAPRAPGRIEATTYLGERSHLHVRVPGRARRVAVSAQNTALQGRPAWPQKADRSGWSGSKTP